MIGEFIVGAALAKLFGDFVSLDDDDEDEYDEW